MYSWAEVKVGEIAILSDGSRMLKINGDERLDDLLGWNDPDTSFNFNAINIDTFDSEYLFDSGTELTIDKIVTKFEFCLDLESVRC